MDTKNIIEGIDAEISRLQQVKELLTGVSGSVKRKAGRPIGSGKSAKVVAVRTLSPESREKIAAAQRARWAKSRKIAKKEARKSVLTKAAARTSVKSNKAKKVVKAKKAFAPRTETSTPVTTASAS